MRSAAWLGWAALLVACAARSSPERADAASRGGARGGPEPHRRLCGWDVVDGPGTPAAVTVGATGRPSRAGVTPGLRIAVLRVAEDATMADLLAALRPAAESLVRVKIAMDETALLPLTVPGRPVPLGGPTPAPTETAIVGHRRVTRPRAAPRDRLADLRVADGEVTVFVENDKPGGRAMPTSALAGYLRGVEPPVGVFTLGADDATPWPRLREVITAAACYDRAPGEEPHEVLLPLDGS